MRKYLALLASVLVLAILAGLTDAQAAEAQSYDVGPSGSVSNEPGTSTGMQATLYSCGSSVYTLTNREYNTAVLVNRERVERGIRKMCVHGALLRSSRYWSAEMAERNFFAHGCFECRLDMFNYPWVWAQENLQYFFNSSPETPREVVNAWISSDSHRRAMFNGNNHEFAVGVRSNANYTFTTMDMGRR